jgi:hypothetical protein
MRLLLVKHMFHLLLSLITMEEKPSFLAIIDGTSAIFTSVIDSDCFSYDMFCPSLHLRIDCIKQRS